MKRQPSAAVLVLFFVIQLLAIGLSSSTNGLHRKTEVPIAMEKTWEVQHFINTNVLVESESDMDQFVALREKRDSMRSQNGDGEDFDSGCGDICEDCHANASCFIKNMGKNYSCACNEGFTGNGTDCEDIDECMLMPKPCSTDAQCNNTIGSYRCTCGANFYGNDSFCSELPFEFSSSDVYSKPGIPAVLICAFNEAVQWKMNGKYINNDTNIKIQNNILVVNSRDDTHYGNYFCELKNFPGKGIKMSLFKVDDGRNDVDSFETSLLVAFIIMLILFVCALIVIVYLVLRKRRQPSTIHRNPAPLDNKPEIEMSPLEGDGRYADVNYTEGCFPEQTSAGVSKEGIYTDLSDNRDAEDIYQGLANPVQEDDHTYEEVSVRPSQA